MKLDNPLKSWPAVGAVALACLALAGCADMSGIQTTAQLRTPETLGLAGPSPADQAAQVSAVDAQWWTQLGDERLDRYVAEALADSPSLKIAQARIAKAAAAVQSAHANELPQVSGQSSVTRQHFSANSIYPPPLGGSNQTLASAQLDARWSLDLFGKERALLEAAVGGARAAEADRDAARVLLASRIVQTYVQLARLQEQEQVAERAIEQRSDTLKLVRDRYDAGLDTRLEVRQSEGGVPEARVQLAQVREQKQLARNALAALLGKPAGADAISASPLAALKLPALPQQLPANLLGRRADVVAARWRVEATQHDIAAAKAAFYPDINLTAFVGLSSLGLDNFIQGSSRQWGVGPALSLPIFDAGRLRANLRGKSADYDAAVESYNQAVIEAVHDVADQLVGVKSALAQQDDQGAAAQAAQGAYELARQRYAAGLGTYLNVLSAETNVLQQRRLAVDLQARILTSHAALAQALGGGYVDAAPATAQVAAHGN
ncbi:efflux transporter outer membrane subunit [Comamonas humi]